jgi:beta-N-acetylhexosaminidase
LSEERLAAGRLVVGLEGPEPTAAEERLYRALAPLGFILFRRNLVSARQAAGLVERLRGFSDPAPLLFVDQEGGTVDRLGPLLGINFPSPRVLAENGADAVHEGAFLMGRAARLLGFDVDFAPALDLGPPGAGADVLAGRTFGFHSEEIVVAGMVFLHGLARAGIGSCLKHFPGLGRAVVDSHLSLPVVEAHDVDLMVTDVAPFSKLARGADGVMVSHAAYPGFTGDGDRTPASQSPVIHRILRGPCGFDGVVYSDDLNMGALDGTVPERGVRAAAAGCDVLVVSVPGESFEETVRGVARTPGDAAGAARRIAELRRREKSWPRTAFTDEGWSALEAEARDFVRATDERAAKIVRETGPCHGGPSFPCGDD